METVKKRLYNACKNCYEFVDVDSETGKQIEVEEKSGISKEPLRISILQEEYDSLKSHSSMLGKIATIVEDFCEEHHTTLDGVRFLEAEKNKYKAISLELKNDKY